MGKNLASRPRKILGASGSTFTAAKHAATQFEPQYQMYSERTAVATHRRDFESATAPGVFATSDAIAASQSIDTGRMAAQLETHLEASRLDLDRLNDINRVVEQAVSTWKVADRVRRLALPSLRYNEIDLQYMRFLLLDDSEGEAVATAAWEESEFNGPARGAGSLQLHGLYVLPRWQRQGLGSSLVDFVGLWAAMHGVDTITARAWREAQPFFHLHGFEPLAGKQSPEGHFDLLRRSSRWMH